MKTLSSGPLNSRGFALVVTLSLMILLTLVAVGLLSLSAVSMRSSSQAKAESDARANARMALMFAIGELQKYTGPDTRITAPADIIEPNAPALTGVWKSWEGTDHDTTGRPIKPNYSVKTKTESENGRFLTWLVSGAEPGTAPLSTSPSTLVSKTSSDDNIPLLSARSLGSNPGQVHLKPQLLKNNTGAYAWWVSPENQKARLAQPHKPGTNSAAGWSDMARTHAVPDPEPFGLENLLDDPEDHTPDPSNPKPARKAFTLRSTELLASSSSSKPQHDFHDLSATSTGLLTNTATGGWRKDLSILTEKWSSLPASGLPLFRLTPSSTTSASKPTTTNPTPGQSMFYPWSAYPAAAGTTIFPIYRHGATTSWQALSDYVTSYKKIDFNTASGVATVPLTWSRVDYNRNGGSTMGGAIKQAELYDYLHTVRKTPILARVQWIFSLQARRNAPNNANDQKFIVDQLVTPVYTLWNPYNTAIEVNGAFGVAVNKVPSLAWALTSAALPDPIPKNLHKTFIRGSRFAPDGTDKYDQTIPGNYTSQHFPIDGQGAAFPTSFTLAPGEAKVFSPVSLQSLFGGTGNMLELREGYDGGSPTGHPRNGNCITGSPGTLAWTDKVKISMRFDNITVLGAGSDYEGPGIALNFGKRGTSWDRYITDVFTTYTTLTNKDFAQAYWLQPADLPKYSISEIAINNTATPAQPTTNRPWTPVFSIIFGPRLSIGAGAGNESDRPTKGMLQNSPFVSGVLTNSRPESTNHPVNGAYDFAYHGHPDGSETIPDDSNGPGYIRTGVLAGNGLSRLVMAELPLRPIASLAELQGWDMRAHNPLPPFQYNIVGNSDAVPTMPKDSVVQNPNANASLNFQHDDAYCANHLLFDDWFFSSIAPEPRDFGKAISRNIDTVYREYLKGQRELVNRAYRPITEDKAVSDQVATTRIGQILNSADGWQKVASRFEVEGMFNINSTSVKAWRALLGHARNQQVAYHTRNGIKVDNSEEDHVVSRLAVASDIKAGPAAGMSGAFNNSSEYTGFRTLDDSQLDDLADKIVEQVRKRGPFLSLSEFINRKLDGDEGLALAGAIQTALNSLSKDPHKVLKDEDYASQTMSGNDPKLNGANYIFPKAAEGMDTFGMPGWIRQADVLRPIAPILSARDDTFTIRTYGDARDAKGNVIARAWCEAVVQRTRDFADQSEAADLIGPPTKQYNLKYGRSYAIVSFRWLASGEV